MLTNRFKGRYTGALTTLALACALLAPLLTTEPAAATSPGRNGKIAFFRDGAIYSMNPDGTGLRRLVGSASNPSWSPDGQKIAYMRWKVLSTGDIVQAIMTMNADGSGRSKVVPDVWGHVSWSPNGKWLAFSRSEGVVNTNIWIQRLDGTGLRQVTFLSSQTDPHPGGHGLDPAWAPDGKKIAFQAYWNGRAGADIWVVNRDGTGLKRVVHMPRGALSPSWSPDGKWLAFTTPAAHIWIVRLNGSGLRNLTKGRYLYPAQDPAWSPDGTRIAFSAPGPGNDNSRIWTIKIDGTDARQVTWLQGARDIQSDWQALG